MLPDQPDDPQPTPDQAAEPDREADRESELLFSLANALNHISADLEAIRSGIETVLRGQERAWAASKRQEHLLLKISRALDEGQSEEGSERGF
jgi:hypothetical protein